MNFPILNSYQREGYICQKYPKGFPVQPPEGEIQGYCPEGFYPFKNRCFSFHGFGQDEIEKRKNADQAKDECSKIGATLGQILTLNKFCSEHG